MMNLFDIEMLRASLPVCLNEVQHGNGMDWFVAKLTRDAKPTTCHNLFGMQIVLNENLPTNWIALKYSDGRTQYMWWDGEAFIILPVNSNTDKWYNYE